MTSFELANANVKGELVVKNTTMNNVNYGDSLKVVPTTGITSFSLQESTFTNLSGGKIDFISNNIAHVLISGCKFEKVTATTSFKLVMESQSDAASNITLASNDFKELTVADLQLITSVGESSMINIDKNTFDTVNGTTLAIASVTGAGS